MSPRPLPHPNEAPGRNSRRARVAAFSQVECVVVVAGVLFLALLALPALAGLRSTGDHQVCASNFRQLSRAWALYVEDNAGRLPGVLDGGEAINLNNTNRSWVVGWLDNSTFRADNTNLVALANAQLGAYTRTVSIYRCPSDRSLSAGRSGTPRVRSVSLNSYVGTRSGPYTAGYRQFLTLDQIVDPRPAECLLFVDEREDSINDGCFFVNMADFDPPRPEARIMVDYPTARHDGGATMSFVDGHVETWRWLDDRTRPPLDFAKLLPLGQGHPNNPDIARIQASTSRRE